MPLCPPLPLAVAHRRVGDRLELLGLVLEVGVEAQQRAWLGSGLGLGLGLGLVVEVGVEAQQRAWLGSGLGRPSSTL